MGDFKGLQPQDEVLNQTVDSSVSDFEFQQNCRRQSTSASETPFTSLNASTTATSLAADDQYLLVDGIYIMKPSSRPESWTVEQNELRNDIDTQISNDLRSQHSYMIRLKCVGKSSTDCRPAILIIATSDDTKNCIASCVASWISKRSPLRKRLLKSKLSLHVVLQKCYAAFHSNSTPDDIFVSEHAMKEVDIEISSFGNGCAISLKSKESGAMSYCVGGGILMVGDQAVIHTSRHALECLVYPESPWQASATSTPDISTSSTSEGAISFWFSDFEDEDGDEVGSSTASDVSTAASLLENESPQLVQKQIEGTSSLNISASTSAQIFEQKLGGQVLSAKISHHDNSGDWLMLKLDPNSNDTSLAYVENEIGGYVIDEIFDGDLLSPLPVNISLPGGEVSGLLQGESVIYRVGHLKFELLLVTVDASLRRGCSGAWVTHQNELRGTVMAVSEDLPEIFILPFAKIRPDMERICGQSICLPQEQPRDFKETHLKFPHGIAIDITGIADPEGHVAAYDRMIEFDGGWIAGETFGSSSVASSGIQNTTSTSLTSARAPRSLSSYTTDLTQESTTTAVLNREPLPPVAGWRPSLVVSIDFGMTGTAVSYSSAPDWEEPKYIQTWPGSSKTLKNKVPSQIWYDEFGNVAGWGFKRPTILDTTVLEKDFKLYLDPQFQDEYPHRPNHREALQYYEDFMDNLLQHINSYFGSSVPNWTETNVEFLLSTPATWNENLPLMLLAQTLRKTGYGTGIHRRFMVAENEAVAAATCAAKQYRGVGDVIMVVDAGGSTTDIAVLATDQNTAQNRYFIDLCGQTGINIGSTLIDGQALRLVVEKLRDLGASIGDSALHSVVEDMMQQHGFESYKCLFKGTETQIDIKLSIPEGLLPTTSNAQMSISISGKDMKQFFDSQIRSMLIAIDQQLSAAHRRAPDQSVKHLVLSGGLGSSPYVQWQLRNRYGNLNVICGPEPQLVVAKGLVIARIQTLHRDVMVQTRKRPPHVRRFHGGWRSESTHSSHTNSVERPRSWAPAKSSQIDAESTVQFSDPVT